MGDFINLHGSIHISGHYSQVKEYFLNAYDLGELLFTAIKGNSQQICKCVNTIIFINYADENYFYKCPDRLRLPLIFYLAHTASFYINKMILAGLIDVHLANYV